MKFHDYGPHGYDLYPVNGQQDRQADNKQRVIVIAQLSAELKKKKPVYMFLMNSKNPKVTHTLALVFSLYIYRLQYVYTVSIYLYIMYIHYSLQGYVCISKEGEVPSSLINIGYMYIHSINISHCKKSILQYR